MLRNRVAALKVSFQLGKTNLKLNESIFMMSVLGCLLLIHVSKEFVGRTNEAMMCLLLFFNTSKLLRLVALVLFELPDELGNGRVVVDVLKVCVALPGPSVFSFSTSARSVVSWAWRS